MTDSEEQNPASAPRNRDISSVTCAASARGEPREPEHSPASGVERIPAPVVDALVNALDNEGE